MKRTVERVGVVAELDGKYWGVMYADGQSKSYGFGSIEGADISDPKYCTKPTDKTWDPHWPKPNSRYNGDYEALEKATLRTVKITTTYEVEEVRQENRECN